MLSPWKTRQKAKGKRQTEDRKRMKEKTKSVRSQKTESQGSINS